jgi:exopolyphosphatase/guanosine-5'-triphosphate,3'-diphosphate pyrophosphatase
LHGYVLERRRLDEVTGALAAIPASNRATTPGLNADRADSIVGGGLIVQAVMDRLRASDLTVAGYGLREGIALRSVGKDVAAIDAVRQAAVECLGRQFGSYVGRMADRRTALALRVLGVLAPRLSAEAQLAASAAARLLDIGASIDHYRRHAHAARIVCDANLDGYSHRALALMAAALYAVGEREATIKGYAPLLGGADLPTIEQIAAGVGLADALMRYGSADPEAVSLERTNGRVVLASPVVDTWPLEAPARRAERAFGITLRIRDDVAVA